jgi:hypothetical protein
MMGGFAGYDWLVTVKVQLEDSFKRAAEQPDRAAAAVVRII